ADGRGAIIEHCEAWCAEGLAFAVLFECANGCRQVLGAENLREGILDTDAHDGVNSGDGCALIDGVWEIPTVDDAGKVLRHGCALDGDTLPLAIGFPEHTQL